MRWVHGATGAAPSTSASRTASTSTPAPSARRSAGRAAVRLGPARDHGMLRQKGRPYLFSNSLAPSIVAATLTALELVEGSAAARDAVPQRRAVPPPHERGGLRAAARRARDRAGDVRGCGVAGRIADAMLEHGVYVTAFSYPWCRRGRPGSGAALRRAHRAGRRGRRPGLRRLRAAVQEGWTARDSARVTRRPAGSAAEPHPVIGAHAQAEADRAQHHEQEVTPATAAPGRAGPRAPTRPRGPRRA